MKKSRKRGFAPLAVIIIIVALAAAVGVLVYQENVGINPVQEITPVSTNTISQTQEGSISSFAIVPSTKEGQSWTMYKKGAKAILKAKNITSAELWYTPTGTEIKSTFGGTMSKVGVDTWELELPANLLTTSFWAEATNLTGKKIKSVNIGNVGYGEAKPSPLGTAGRGDEGGVTCGERTIMVETVEDKRMSDEPAYLDSVWVDGKYDRSYSNGYIGDIVFSSDCKQYAYEVYTNDKWFIVLNGKQLKSYEFVNHPEFSLNGIHFAYIALIGQYPSWKALVVVDGVEGKSYEGGIKTDTNHGARLFSPDSKHVIYSAGEGKKYDNPIEILTFSADSKKVTYKATLGSKIEMVTENLD